MRPTQTWEEGLGLPGVHQTTLKDSTESLIRHALLSGVMKPGQIYSANSLAAHLGVSNSPAREAMMSLANKGLLEPVRNRGFRVVDLSPHDRQEVYDLRVLIEVEAVCRVTAAGVLEEHAAHLHDLARQVVDASEGSDMAEYLERDQDFHLSLVGLLGNSRLTATVATLRDQARINGSYHLQELGLVRSSALEHLEIADAVIAGDPARARTLMLQHMDYSLPHES